MVRGGFIEFVYSFLHFTYYCIDVTPWYSPNIGSRVAVVMVVMMVMVVTVVVRLCKQRHD